MTTRVIVSQIFSAEMLFFPIINTYFKEQSNLDDILKNMETDPFSGIKQYLISQGTFWNDTETEADTEVDKSNKPIVIAYKNS